MRRSAALELAQVGGVLLAAALMRAAALFGGVARLLRSDEATNGVVALDILRGGPVPFFQYGDRYGGGQVVESLLMVPLFRFFGASEITLKAVPAAGSIVFLAVFYLLLRRHLPSRTALTAMGLLALSAPFLACSFTVYGNMPTAIAGWTGLAFAFESIRRSRPDAVTLLLSGLFLGFSYYCHPSSVLLIAGALAALAITQHRLLLRPALPLASWFAGLVAGASPLLAYHLSTGESAARETTFDLTRVAADPGSFIANAGQLFAYDLPRFFSIDVFDFTAEIPRWSAAMAITVFLISLAGVAAARNAFREWPACRREKRAWSPDEAGWAWAWLGFSLLFAVLYCLHPRSGTASRYLMPVYPFLVLLVAWGVLALRRRGRLLGWAAALLYLGLQVPLLAELARRETTTEWGIEVRAADVHRVLEFLDARGYTAVVAPYEIKWKLLFLSQGRVQASASPFGFDRETIIDQEVLRRIDGGEVPLVIVLDRELRYPGIVQGFNPGQAFYPEEFFGFLREQGITHEAVPLGDFVVFHRFSKGVSFRRAPVPE